MTGRCLSFRALATLLFTCTSLVLALHAQRIVDLTANRRENYARLQQGQGRRLAESTKKYRSSSNWKNRFDLERHLSLWGHCSRGCKSHRLAQRLS